MSPDAQQTVEGRFCVETICGAFVRINSSDPTTRWDKDRFWLTSRTPQGPASIECIEEQHAVTVRGYGPGASWATARARRLLGADDDPSTWSPGHPLLDEALRRQPEIRFGRTDTLVDNLVPAILGQRVTVQDAARSWRSLVSRYGDPAPGPAEGLMLPPDPERLAGEPYYALHPIGIERLRAGTLLEVARRHRRIGALAELPPLEAEQKLHSLSGIGPWTTATLLVASHGDPDAVPVGDLHLPHSVSWALAGEPRADDDRMLELLAPYAGHRARVLRLLRSVPSRPPRRGPKLEVLDIRKL